MQNHEASQDLDKKRAFMLRWLMSMFSVFDSSKAPDDPRSSNAASVSHPQSEATKSSAVNNVSLSRTMPKLSTATTVAALSGVAVISAGAAISIGLFAAKASAASSVGIKLAVAAAATTGAATAPVSLMTCAALFCIAFVFVALCYMGCGVQGLLCLDAGTDAAECCLS